MNEINRIGYIVDGLAPTIKKCAASCSILPLLRGWPGVSSIQVARFIPLLEEPRLAQARLRYELYRPWQRYDAIVFLKSMSSDCLLLAEKFRKLNVKTVFDLNVDYLNQAEGSYYYEGMAPTIEQNLQARQMIDLCSAVIADSSWLHSVAEQYNQNTIWIPDCVGNNFLKERSDWVFDSSVPLPVIWCGESVKLFELLVAEDVLRAFRKKIHLRIITNSLTAIKRIYQPWRDRLNLLLRDLNPEVIPFKNIANLATCYDQGGIFISPRFLNNTYNLGHTEWKITLPMARGRIVLCSPQASYVDVAELSQNRGIRVCNGPEDWMEAFEEFFSKRDWIEEQAQACDVVRKHYSASAVAEIHAKFMRKLLESR